VWLLKESYEKIMLRETKEQSLGKNLAVSFANKIEYVV
jgi:hypothetical protein